MGRKERGLRIPYFFSSNEKLIGQHLFGLTHLFFLGTNKFGIKLYLGVSWLEKEE
jgi:hypothetical protein